MCPGFYILFGQMDSPVSVVSCGLFRYQYDINITHRRTNAQVLLVERSLCAMKQWNKKKNGKQCKKRDELYGLWIWNRSMLILCLRIGSQPELTILLELAGAHYPHTTNPASQGSENPLCLSAWKFPAGHPAERQRIIAQAVIRWL